MWVISCCTEGDDYVLLKNIRNSLQKPHGHKNINSTISVTVSIHIILSLYHIIQSSISILYNNNKLSLVLTEHCLSPILHDDCTHIPSMLTAFL